MSKNIFHIAPIGSGYNIGNFAISLSVRSLINKVYPLSNIITIPAHGSPSNGLSKSVIHQANQSNSSIIVGGGNLIENNELNIDFNALESIQVPLVLFSVSRGDIYNSNLKLSRRTDAMPDNDILKLHKYVTSSISRDIATQDYYKNIGVKNSVMGGCPTIFMDEWFNDRLHHIHSRDDVCYISIRNPEQMNIPLKNQLKIPSFIREVYELLIENGYKNVQMLCHDQRDISFAESIDGIGYYYTSDIYEYLSLIKKSPLIVSMRVHSSLPSAALKTPFVNISYDQRGQSLMSAIGLEDWDINLLLDDNPIDLIRDRINSLSKLNSLIESNSTLWDGLYDKQLEAINKL